MDRTSDFLVLAMRPAPLRYWQVPGIVAELLLENYAVENNWVLFQKMSKPLLIDARLRWRLCSVVCVGVFPGDGAFPVVFYRGFGRSSITGQFTHFGVGGLPWGLCASITGQYHWTIVFCSLFHRRVEALHFVFDNIVKI